MNKSTNIYTVPRDRVTYNYRYFLPHAPVWGSADFCEQRLAELLDFCREADIAAVQFFVNTLPGIYHMPPFDAASQAPWATWMKERVRPALRAAGISYQINFQMLLGASPFGLDMREKYGWDFLVDQYGEETLGCACPLSPGFRQRMGEMLRLWAGTEPEVFWVDDDFRLHGHGLGNHEMDCYCFCRRHLEAFSQTSGHAWSRKELVAEILSPGVPSPARLAWLDFLDATVNETAAWICREVQSVSPRTRLAQMTSAPDVHALEGRNWKSFLEALCGPYPPITRPCSGVYTGTAVPVKAQTITFRFMAQSMAMAEQALGAGAVEFAPELENTRFTTWSKSGANTRYVLFLGQLLGCPHITLSVHDLTGSPIEQEPTLRPLLRQVRPCLEALASLGLSAWEPQGVGFLADSESARKVELAKGARMQDLGLLRNWEDILLQMGVPARYVSPAQAASAGEVVVLEEFTAWLPSKDELLKILAGPVLLDGGAARVLQHRGLGRYLGVKVLGHHADGVPSEKYQDHVLPGVASLRIPHFGQNWCELEREGASVVSDLIDPLDRHFPGSTVFENTLGGRIGIYAAVGDFSPMGTFGNHARLQWLHAVLVWLSRGRFCALPVLPHHGLSIVRTRPGETLLAFANLGTDPLSSLTVRLPGECRPASVAVLEGSGAWAPAECRYELNDRSGGGRLTTACHLNAFEWLILRLSENRA